MRAVFEVCTARAHSLCVVLLSAGRAGAAGLTGSHGTAWLRWLPWPGRQTWAVRAARRAGERVAEGRNPRGARAGSLPSACSAPSFVPTGPAGLPRGPGAGWREGGRGKAVLHGCGSVPSPAPRAANVFQVITPFHYWFDWYCTSSTPLSACVPYLGCEFTQRSAQGILALSNQARVSGDPFVISAQILCLFLEEESPGGFLYIFSGPYSVPPPSILPPSRQNLLPWGPSHCIWLLLEIFLSCPTASAGGPAWGPGVLQGIGTGHSPVPATTV